MIGAVACVGIVALVMRWLLTPDPAPIYNVYSQRGKFYHLKYMFFYMVMYLRQVNGSKFET